MWLGWKRAQEEARRDEQLLTSVLLLGPEGWHGVGALPGPDGTAPSCPACV